MKVFTSIVPRKLCFGEVDRQQLAIESWLKAGFEPVSLNCAEECEQLVGSFSEVEFRETLRDGSAEMGKPLIYIDDILAAVAAESGHISGIVNSDIIFRSAGNLPAELARVTGEGLIYGCRLDISSPADTQGKIYDIGFDFFFLNRELAGKFPSSKLCLGAPMWDYWVPLISSKLGYSTAFLRNIIAWHIVHEQAWSQQVNLFMLGELIKQSGLEFAWLNNVDFNTLDQQGINALHEFSQYILPYLFQNSQMVEAQV